MARAPSVERVVEGDDGLLAGFGLEQRRRGLREGTIRRRRYLLARFLKAHPDPFAATVEDVQVWLDSCHIGPRSRATYLSTLHVFYDWALRSGSAYEDPTAVIRPPRTSRLVPRPIAVEDLALALSHADRRMRLWLQLAAYQGLRCIEIANLRREDVLDTHDPPLLRVTGKGGHQRVLPLNAEVERSLRLHGLPRSGYIFRLQSGRPLKAATVSTYIGRFLHGLGLDASAHRLRHLFGTSVYGQTSDLRLTQELLGHRSPATTAIYAGYRPEKAYTIVRHLDVSKEWEQTKHRVWTNIETQLRSRRMDGGGGGSYAAPA